ncbi:unnamed protein product, partial [Mesorhabditis belari]|uniref:Uncharacterized protein n=1 Tax=Mesorhabditis belari TaxID=2138241 RepID=A0AAF3EGW8_9BILA
MSHGPQCICQICTCGRHRCPHDRNASSMNFGDDSSGFQRKEYAVSHGEGRSPIHRPRGELSAQNLGALDSNMMTRSETREAYQGADSDSKHRFVTSAAFKKRNQQSQVFIQSRV